ncbi:rCG42927, isoform CRA_c [Rattus norvegicus]|uniref:RCG42927, isoform CRA_c n=1 Tax=Rattus norvegicus TaxID=10116 RepID=A6JZZ3_RAT|nr:rCG42927, isoform CRA_c [Rattus norvegicus]
MVSSILPSAFWQLRYLLQQSICVCSLLVSQHSLYILDINPILKACLIT